jgi:hypothetical protein
MYIHAHIYIIYTCARSAYWLLAAPNICIYIHTHIYIMYMRSLRLYIIDIHALAPLTASQLHPLRKKILKTIPPKNKATRSLCAPASDSRCWCSVFFWC